MSTCVWYTLCDRSAVGTVAHPVLGDVPTCKRCADKHGLEIETAVAWDRPETDPCEAGTVGCSVNHTAAPDGGCETW